MGPEELLASVPPSLPERPEETVPLDGKPWGFWMTALLCGIILLGFLIAQAGLEIAFLVAWMLDHPGGDPYTHVMALQEDGFFISVATCVGAPVGFALVLLFARLRKGIALRDYLALVPAGSRTHLVWLGATVVFMIVTDSLRMFAGDPLVPDVMRSWYVSARFPLLLGFAFVMLAPIFEEALFRGFLFRGIEVSPLGAAGAILLSAGLWSILHFQYNLTGVATVLFFGLLLGFARKRTGSLYVCVGMHALNNFVATIETAIVAGQAG